MNETIFESRFTKKTNENSNSAESVNPEVGRCSQVIDKILELTAAQYSDHSKEKQNEVSDEPMLQIPVFLIQGAWPLITYLSNIFSSTISQSEPKISNAAGLNDASSGQILNISPVIQEKPAPKKSRKRGTALDASSDEHIESLLMESNAKKIKIEKQEKLSKEKKQRQRKAKPKPGIKSNVLLTAPIQVMPLGTAVESHSNILKIHQQRTPLTDIQIVDELGNPIQNLPPSTINFPQQCNEYQVLSDYPMDNTENSYIQMLPCLNNSLFSSKMFMS